MDTNKDGKISIAEFESSSWALGTSDKLHPHEYRLKAEGPS